MNTIQFLTNFIKRKILTSEAINGSEVRNDLVITVKEYFDNGIYRRGIKMAAKFYKCIDADKALYGVDYFKKVHPYKNIIQNHQAKFSLDVLPSVIELCNFEGVRDNEFAIMLLMSAAVELIEPLTDK